MPDRLYGHCAVRVISLGGRFDTTIEMIPTGLFGLNGVYFSSRGSDKERDFTGSWVPVDVPEGMTSIAFDVSVVACALREQDAREGTKYKARPSKNSNNFVRSVITCAGGEVPKGATGRFIFGAPGLGDTAEPSSGFGGTTMAEEREVRRRMTYVSPKRQ